MKILKTLAACLLLLVSAAAASGNGNTANVTVNQDLLGSSVTWAEMDQRTSASVTISGNYNVANQKIDLDAVDNSLVGQNGPWGREYFEQLQSGHPLIGASPAAFRQVAILTGDATGNSNEIAQQSDLDAHDNSMTLGAFHALGQVVAMGSLLEVSAVGNENEMTQNTSASLNNNLITMASLSQTSELMAFTDGSLNIIDQRADQKALENHIANEDPYVLGFVRQDILMVANTVGSENKITTGVEQEGSSNSLTNSRFLQSVEQEASSTGYNNNLEQSVIQTSNGNSAVSSNIVQEASINSVI